MVICKRERSLHYAGDAIFIIKLPLYFLNVTMIYITAQPDENYFLWQLKLQLFNFNRLGIVPEQVHVLIGFDKTCGLNPKFKEFISTNKKATFYIYPDTRSRRRYPSSIRPHLIYQHYHKYKNLEKEVVFYHDSDIIFKEIPPWDDLLHDAVWYVSDTSSYLGIDYVLNKIGEKGFHAMCEIVGVDPVLVKSNNSAGGAQYLLKNVEADFWKKIENDCEDLYTYLIQYSGNEDFPEKRVKQGIQAWCADMWAIWWNALLWNKQFQIHSYLTFCWANGSIEEWNKNYILHYTGSVGSKKMLYFRKLNYCYYEPFYDDFSSVSKESCSYPLVQMINVFKECQDRRRIGLKDFTFVITLSSESLVSCANLYILLKYIAKYIDTSFIIVEIGKEQLVAIEKLPINSSCRFYKRKKRLSFDNELLLSTFDSIQTKYIMFHDVNTIVPISQIEQCATLLRENEEDFLIYPYNKEMRRVDVLSKSVFARMIDAELLLQNIGKMVTVQNEYFGSVCACQKEDMPIEVFSALISFIVGESSCIESEYFKVDEVSGDIFLFSH